MLSVGAFGNEHEILTVDPRDRGHRYDEPVGRLPHDAGANELRLSQLAVWIAHGPFDENRLCGFINTR